MKLIGNKAPKHQFLRRVVRLCLVMLSVITLGVLALAWHSGEQLSASTTATLVGAWCGELLMSLLKRRGDEEKAPTQVKKYDRDC